MKTITVARCAECPWFGFEKVSEEGRTDDFRDWCNFARRELPELRLALDEAPDNAPPPAWCPLRDGALVRVGS
jgi:hypothetical protein